MIRKLIPLLLCLLCLFGFGASSARAEDAVWDLSAASAEELEQRFLEALEDESVQRIDLGSGEAEDGRIPWETLAHLRAARPELEVDYAFTLCGCRFTLEDTVMDLRRREISDQGALVRRIAPCMPNLCTLDMDSCGVDDEHMAAIRDALPQVNVVWRIWFGDRTGGLAGYSVRTDVERILASNPGIGGELTPENTEPLKYCTRVKYLDLGHNSYLRSLDFVRYMPDLELLIVAMGDWYDLSPLENCEKLVYAELQTSAVSDLRPLTKLKNLKHLNFGWCFALHDITPLYEMTQLERLWIGCLTPVPDEQIERMRELVPGCVIETEINDPTDAGWRYLGHTEWGETIVDPTYQWVRDMMHYSEGNYAYAYPYNDPLLY